MKKLERLIRTPNCGDVDVEVTDEVNSPSVLCSRRSSRRPCGSASNFEFLLYRCSTPNVSVKLPSTTKDRLPLTMTPTVNRLQLIDVGRRRSKEGISTPDVASLTSEIASPLTSRVTKNRRGRVRRLLKAGAVVSRLNLDIDEDFDNATIGSDRCSCDVEHRRRMYAEHQPEVKFGDGTSKSCAFVDCSESETALSLKCPPAPKLRKRTCPDAEAKDPDSNVRDAGTSMSQRLRFSTTSTQVDARNNINDADGSSESHQLRIVEAETFVEHHHRRNEVNVVCSSKPDSKFSSTRPSIFKSVFDDRSQYLTVHTTLDFGVHPSAANNIRWVALRQHEANLDLGLFVLDGDLDLDALSSADLDLNAGTAAEGSRPQLGDKLIGMNGLNVTQVSNGQVIRWLEQAATRRQTMKVELARTADERFLSQLFVMYVVV